ncbi:MAG: GDSL-type esterase/lipase family protein, partial [Candidatus Aminicenantes bacterium]|nr:GDSL-type esterase/lipase family protein [Candidatus Aminicenantes bacterium]
MKASTGKAFALFILFALLPACSPSQRGVIVLCAGDSLTESSYPKFLKNILNTAGIRAKVLNYGRSGNTTGEYLSYLLENKESFAEKQPDIVCLLLGTNDVRNDQDNTSSSLVYSNLKDILAIFSQFKDPDGNKTRILLST